MRGGAEASTKADVQELIAREEAEERKKWRYTFAGEALIGLLSYADDDQRRAHQILHYEFTR